MTWTMVAVLFLVHPGPVHTFYSSNTYATEQACRDDMMNAAQDIVSQFPRYGLSKDDVTGIGMDCVDTDSLPNEDNKA